MPDETEVNQQNGSAEGSAEGHASPAASIASDGAEPNAKRRKRRSGWDTPAPVGSPAAAGVSPLVAGSMSPLGIQVPGLTAGLPMALPGGLAALNTMMASTVPNPMLTTLQSQLAQQQVAQALGMAVPGAFPKTVQQTAMEDAQKKRMQCRIYVGSLHYGLKETDVKAIFAAFGSIKNIDMSVDASTGRHKGFCFIEYMDAEAADQAVSAMNNFELAGRPIKVGRPHNAAQSSALPTSMTSMTGLSSMGAISPLTGQPFGMVPPLPGVGGVGALSAGSALMQAQLAAAKAGTPIPKGNTKLYVGNVQQGITGEMVKTVFAPFGNVLGCEMVADPLAPGQHRGYGFIQFGDEATATSAKEAMNGFELAGRSLKVDWASDQTKPAGTTVVVPPKPPGPVDVQAALSAALAGCGAAASPSMLPAGGGSPAPALLSGSSRVVMLLDMVAPHEAKDPSLKDEIMEEARKYGNVDQVEIFTHQVDGEVAGIRVFVQYRSILEAASAISKLNNRFFAGNTIKATHYDDTLFHLRILDK